MFKILSNYQEIIKTSVIGIFFSNLSTEYLHLFHEEIKPLYQGIDYNNLINVLSQIVITSIATYQIIKLAKINKNKK